ncbi:Gx transporter family protein [Atopobacter phocae]|uniref:Gx transporter family protein n=1 Tax=Atopobacter phocae TaxID=136492 RepID=UPI0004BB8B9F|nr:Gx transporter family protein [Atopobacter phocae]
MVSRQRIIMYIALLAAYGIVIGLLEQMIPIVISFAPGSKLGLANLVTIIALFTLDVRDSLKVVWLRLLVGTLLGGTLSTFLYSFAGAFLSYFAMLLAKQLGPRWISVIGVSTLGGFMHNFGQLVVASLIARSFTVLLYLPVLSVTGLVSGILVGVCGNYLLARIPKLRIMHQSMVQRQKKDSWT